jgi:hypothetical protein
MPPKGRNCALRRWPKIPPGSVAAGVSEEARVDRNLGDGGGPGPGALGPAAQSVSYLTKT